LLRYNAQVRLQASQIKAQAKPTPILRPLVNCNDRHAVGAGMAALDTHLVQNLVQ
jgi:hypothetical protein